MVFSGSLVHKSENRRAASLKRTNIGLFVVANPVLPAAEDYPDPFVGQCSNSCVMALPHAPLHVIVSASPGTKLYRLPRKFVEGLPEKLGTGEAPVYPNMFPAAVGNRSDPGILLNFAGGLESAPVRAHRRHRTAGISA